MAYERWKIIKPILYPDTRISRARLDKSFAGETIVITGASQGIGEAVTRSLMTTRCTFILIARNEEKLKALCKEAQVKGCKATYYALDLRNHTALDNLCAQLKSIPQIDYIFYHAGKSIHRDISEATDRLHDYDRTMNVNYRAFVAICLSLFHQMKQAHGKLVYISSVSTLFPEAPGWSAYHASKCAANSWCHTAANEWAKYHIDVKIAYMPLVHTKMSDATETYRRLPGYSKEEAAHKVLHLAMSHQQSYKPWWAKIGAPLSQLLEPLITIIYKKMTK